MDRSENEDKNNTVDESLNTKYEVLEEDVEPLKVEKINIRPFGELLIKFSKPFLPIPFLTEKVGKRSLSDTDAW